MPLFQVKTREIIEHTYEVWARNEEAAEIMVYDGFPEAINPGDDGIADHWKEDYGTEILDQHTIYLEDDPEPEELDD